MYLSEVYLSGALLFEPEATEVLKAKQVRKLGKLRLETLGSVATRTLEMQKVILLESYT